MTILLGIDPGLGTTGWGVISADGNRLSHIANGRIVTDTKASLANRLVELDRALTDIILEFRPDGAAVEEVFVNSNPQSTLKLGQARGACITALATCNLPVAEYTALQMKQAVAGHGLAKKEQVQEMVKRLLNLPGLPGPDAADALGIAITHAHAGHSMAKLAAATDLQRSTNGMYKAGRSR